MREDARMVPAVAGDLVPRLGDAADQRGMALGHPAQREEGRLDPASSNRASTASVLRSTRRGRPSQSSRSITRLEGADLEPVLDIDRQGVQHVALRAVQAAWRSAAPAVPFHPVDQEGQDAGERCILLVHRASDRCEATGATLRQLADGATSARFGCDCAAGGARVPPLRHRQSPRVGDHPLDRLAVITVGLLDARLEAGGARQAG